MFTSFVFVRARLASRRTVIARPAVGTVGSSGPWSDRGQTTAEYALVLVAVAAIALLILAWATESGAIGKLFDFILSHIMGQVH
jgi:hypothetical protein